VFIALDGFMQFLDVEEQLAVLVCAREHLKEDGLLVVDLSNPSAAGFEVGDSAFLLDWVRPDPESGRLVSKTVSRGVDAATQTHFLTFFYDEVGEDRVLRRSIAELRLHYFYPAEMSLLLRQAGFWLESMYGSYDLDEYSANSPRMIVVAGKTSESPMRAGAGIPNG
jgi:hypothetical protein